MSSPTPLSAACNAFSLSLFKQLSKDNKTGNMFFSPLSISSALAMVLLGARGSTATQMAEVLHFKDDAHMDFSKLMGDLNKSGKSYKLRLANRLYGEQSYQFVEKYLSAIREHCDAQLEAVDFTNNAEVVRLNINHWVEKQTHNKIKDLVAPGTVDEHTRLMLVSAIYFNAEWEKPFIDFKDDEPFKLSKTESTLVKMMLRRCECPLASIPIARCQILELPYVGKDLSMLIFLPDGIEDDTTGLEMLEEQLTYERFMEWTSPYNLRKTRVSLGLPCFKMEATYDLKDILSKMGMESVFDTGRSDLSGMSPANDLVLSKAVHKSFVVVNEVGTEAAAVDAYYGMMGCRKGYVPPAYFFANHPFLLFIRHNPTMSILFAGRCCSPHEIA